ncbi:hypothetical protein D3C78_1015180 [compost metagenome]
MLIKPILDRTKNIQSPHAMKVLLDQSTGNPVNDISRVYPGHAFFQKFILQLLQIRILVPLDFLSIVESHFFDQINPLLLGLFQPGKDGENSCRAEGMRGYMNMTHIALTDQLRINLFLLRNLEVVRNRHHNHPRLQRLIFLVRDKRFVL